MPDNKEYTKEQDKKLDTEISKTQDAGNSLQEDPIQLGAKGEKLADREKKIVTDLVGKFEKWDMWRKPLENKWFEIYRLYFGNDTEVKTPTRAKIFVPMIYKIIESAVPILTNTIFSSESFFEVVPLQEEDRPLAETIQLLLEYQLAKANFYPKFIDYAKQLCLYGTSYFKVFWKVKRQWVWERTPIRKPVSLFGIPFPVEKIVGWKEKKSYKVVDRRPEVDVVDILDVYPDPDAAKVSEGKGIFIKTFMSRDQIREMGAGKFPIYSNTNSDALKSERFDNSYGTSRQQRFTTRGVSNIGGDSKEVEVLEFFGTMDIDQDGIAEEVYIVIANRQVMLKAIGNPFQHQQRPLVKSELFPVPLEWYGIGLVEPIISQQHELNTLRRQRLDNINQILNNMWLIKDTADIDLNTLITSPSGIILTSEMDGIQEMRPGDVTQSAYVEAASLEEEMESATVTKSAQGNPASGKLGRTASGARLIIGQSLEKFGTAIRLIEETALKRVLKLMHQLNLQFLDDDDVFSDPGLYGNLADANITPEMLRADVQFKMVGISEMVGKEAKINQLASFLGMFKDVMRPETVTLIMQKMWKLMGFDEKEIKNLEGAPPSSVRSAAVSGATDIAAANAQTGGDEALANEIGRNGTSVAPQALRNQPPGV